MGEYSEEADRLLASVGRESAAAGAWGTCADDQAENNGVEEDPVGNSSAEQPHRAAASHDAAHSDAAHALAQGGPLPLAPAADPVQPAGKTLAIPLAGDPAAPLATAPAPRVQARRLIAAANELLVLAAELDAGVADAGADGAVPAGECAAADERRWLRYARQIYRRRRNRSHFFEESLFGEPAWDLLLDLFIAAKERKQVPVTSACIGAAVPTTALRWLAILEERGLVVREADPTDARRIFVRLTAAAYGKMVAYVARAAADGEEVPESRR